MIKQEIIEKISKYFKLTNFEAEKIYDDIFAGIIKGVKEDNIADVTNLGEFIIKYNSGDENNKKTVEFLPTLSLEEEINQRAFEESRQFEPPKFVNPQVFDKPAERPPELSVGDENIAAGLKTAEDKVTESFAAENNPVITEEEKLSIEQEHLSVEDEIRRKREEILGKITKPKEEYTQELKQEIKESIIAPPVVIPPVIEKSEEVTIEHIEAKKTIEEVTNIPEEITSKAEEIKADIKETPKEIEEVTEQSFSDFFTEVPKEEHISAGNISSGNINKPVVPPVETTIPPVETVIPPSAVELHNQITGDQNKTNEYQTTITPMPFANGNGNGNGSGNGENYEHKLQDNSYYIWYKDSEPNSTDTQTMSYEYELLYQATKEAEYKSKLRIYVTTFIMFFSIVLILLIFSPVIYKYFFNPAEEQNSEEVQQETGSTEEPQNTTQNTNQASVNSLENQPPVTNTTQEQPKQEVTPPVTQQEQPKQEAPKQEQPGQEQPVQEQPKQEAPKQNTTQNVPGITKSSMGWLDDYNKVIYVQLDNGKFTIQESAWDSDAKANKRISAVGGLIPGLKGNVLKVDLGSKGTWYRARFGEFSTIEEAKQKAEELRNKEKSKLQALLLTFLLYT